jgi:hypothetical protein
MGEIFTALKNTPGPTLLVVGGIVFLSDSLLLFGGQVWAEVAVPLLELGSSFVWIKDSQ